MIALNSNNLPKPFLVNESIGVQSPDNLFKRCLERGLKTLRALPSVYFSEIDQAFLVWGAVTVFIFSLAQFSAMSWTTQAVLDAALTGAGIAITSGLTWAIAMDATLRWVIVLWAVLMSAGTVTTVYGIFCSNVLILLSLCPLWLGLCGAGYGAMAIGMKSRCFTAACWVHFVAIAGLHYLPNGQFFSTGLVMALTLFFFSVVPWDRET